MELVAGLSLKVGKELCYRLMLQDPSLGRFSNDMTNAAEYKVLRRFLCCIPILLC
jgi:hypothetical protein